jgi:hypothetical protein
MSFFARLKKINDDWYKGLKEEYDGYKFNKKVFGIMLLLMFLYIAVTFFASPTSMIKPDIYLECNENTMCENPFYKDN